MLIILIVCFTNSRHAKLTPTLTYSSRLVLEEKIVEETMLLTFGTVTCLFFHEAIHSLADLKNLHQPPSSPVLIRWQFAHRTSHFAISASIISQRATLNNKLMMSAFLEPRT